MSKYTLEEIRIAAYNWVELSDMTPNERCLWQGLGYTYECFRAGYDKKACQELADLYIRLFWKEDEHGRAGA